MSTSDKPISEAAAAELAGVTHSGLAALRKAGCGPAHFWIGRRIRYLPDDVRTWRDAKRRSGASRAGKNKAPADGSVA